jgi:hypothetical protein
MKPTIKQRRQEFCAKLITMQHEAISLQLEVALPGLITASNAAYWKATSLEGQEDKVV